MTLIFVAQLDTIDFQFSNIALHIERQQTNNKAIIHILITR